MHAYEFIGVTGFGLVTLVVFIREIIRDIKMVKEISPSFHDGKISATIVDHIPCLRNDIKPILEYYVNGVRGKYILYGRQER